eukprot:240646_1
MSNAFKRQRKQRIVNNAYVDIDSVTIAPGHNFSNWVDLTKYKLKERDNKLLEIKINKITSIVNDRLTSYDKQIPLFQPSQNTINYIFQQLRESVDKWNGVIINRVKKDLNTFRKYFVIGRRCWNLQKSKLLGDVFWLPIVNDIKQHIQEHIVVQHAMTILLHIIHGLFNATVKFANTKENSLINSASVINAFQLQKWLFQLDDSLNISAWIVIEKQNSHNRNKGVGGIIMNKLRNNLTILSNNTHNNDRKASETHNQTSDKPINTKPMHQIHTTSNDHICDGNNVNTNFNMLPINLNQSYMANRGTSYNVRDIRNSPLMSSSIVSSANAYPFTQFVPVNIQYPMNSYVLYNLCLILINFKFFFYLICVKCFNNN